MPSTQKKLSHASTLLSQAEIDSLVERISTEVLETSFDSVIQKLDACSSKLGLLDTRITEMEGRISDAVDPIASNGTKLTEEENNLEAALEKINDLENRSRRL